MYAFPVAYGDMCSLVCDVVPALRVRDMDGRRNVYLPQFAPRGKGLKSLFNALYLGEAVSLFFRGFLLADVRGNEEGMTSLDNRIVHGVRRRRRK